MKFIKSVKFVKSNCMICKSKGFCYFCDSIYENAQKPDKNLGTSFNGWGIFNLWS
jgi:hypothetical protein